MISVNSRIELSSPFDQRLDDLILFVASRGLKTLKLVRNVLAKETNCRLRSGEGECIEEQKIQISKLHTQQFTNFSTAASPIHAAHYSDNDMLQS